MVPACANSREGIPPERIALRRQEALIDLQRRLLRSRDKEMMLEEAVRCVAQELTVPLAEVLELSSDGERLRHQEGLGFEGLEGIEVGTGLASQAGYTLISKQPMLVYDLRAEGRFEPCERLRRAGAVSGLTVKVHLGRVIYGVIGAWASEPRAFTPEEAGFLQDVAEALGLALKSASELEVQRRALEAERRLSREYGEGRELVSRACATLAACRTAEGALESAARLAAGSLLGDWCFVDVLEEPEGPDAEPVVVRAAVAGPVSDPEQRRIAEDLVLRRVPLDHSAPHGPHRVLASGEQDLIPRLLDEHVRGAAPSEEALGRMRAISPKSYLGVPLRAGRRLVGAMSIITVGDDRPPADDHRLALARDLARAVAYFVDLHLRETARKVDERRGAIAVDDRLPEDPGDAAASSLTRRQREILSLMSEGLSNRGIAERLHLSEKTVGTHAYRAYRTLGVSSRTEAVSRARKLGIL